MYLLLADGWIELLARGLTPERATLAAASWKIPAAPAADKEETSEHRQWELPKERRPATAVPPTG